MKKLLYNDLCRRSNNLNIIRLSLAITVIFSHGFPVLDKSNRREWLFLFTHGQNTFGTLAVNAFFAISGFLILQSWVNSRSIGEYLQKRLLRIYPGFITASFVTDFVFALLGAPDRRKYLHLLIINLKSLFLSSLTLDNPHVPATFISNPLSGAVNNSMWTIRYEFWCYLLVAALGMLGLLRKRYIILTLFCLVFAANTAQELYVFMHGCNVDCYVGITHGRALRLIGLLDFWPRFAVYFLAGGIFYFYRENIPRSHLLLAVCIIAIFTTSIVGCGLNLLLPLCGTYVLLYIGFVLPEYGEALTKYGDFSYGIYLYAFPIQQLLFFYLGHTLNPYTLFFFALICSVPFAIASWYFIESPTLRMKRRTAPVS